MHRLLLIVLTLRSLLALGSSADAKEKKQKQKSGEEVSWKEVPVAVQTTVQQNAAGGKIGTVTKQTKNGVLIYSAEVKEPDGKYNRVAVTDAGKLLGVKEEKGKKKHWSLFGG